MTHSSILLKRRKISNKPSKCLGTLCQAIESIIQWNKIYCYRQSYLPDPLGLMPLHGSGLVMEKIIDLWEFLWSSKIHRCPYGKQLSPKLRKILCIRSWNPFLYSKVSSPLRFLLLLMCTTLFGILLKPLTWSWKIFFEILFRPPLRTTRVFIGLPENFVVSLVIMEGLGFYAHNCKVWHFFQIDYLPSLVMRLENSGSILYFL